jgi:hypothetical protein
MEKDEIISTADRQLTKALEERGINPRGKNVLKLREALVDKLSQEVDWRDQIFPWIPEPQGGKDE